MSAVDWMTLDMKPVARCEGCDWRPGRWADARVEARRHAKQQPGHIVVVDKVKRTTYTAERAS